ncbi:MAG TPA: metal ABC transporter substrate-binding protein [Planctomycetota bacterium]|nr:metal ABC transporter substrate-binding protein [Planctomycetota bacterium]
MRTMLLLVTAAVVALPRPGEGSTPSAGDKPVVAVTLPVLEALAREVGGDDFEYLSLGRADQDPHHVRATPLLQRQLRRADLFIEVGLQLEPWADLVADDSGKPRLQRTGDRRAVASAGIPREQIPAELTRAAGHVHPDGNPHLWLDPMRGKRMGRNIAEALKKAAPDKAQAVDGRLKDFERRLNEAYFGKELVELAGAEELDRRALDGTLLAWLAKEELDGKPLGARAGGWLAKAAPLRARKVIEYHQSWIYAAKAFGFEIAGMIEEKPGIPPGPRHQLELQRALEGGAIAFMLVDNFYTPSLPNTLSRDTGVPVVVVPNQPGGEPGTETYFAFFDHIVGKMAAAVKR